MERKSNQCYHCEKKIHGKPWITIHKEDINTYCCSWRCSQYLRKYIGGSYREYIVNQEDFNFDLVPIIHKPKEKITTNEELQMVQWEIEQEDLRIKHIEEDFYNDFSSDDSDEENHYK